MNIVYKEILVIFYEQPVYSLNLTKICFFIEMCQLFISGSEVFVFILLCEENQKQLLNF